MRGHELAIEQAISARLEPRDEPGEGYFRRVAAYGKHALAEKRSAQRHAVQTPGKLAVPPALDGMGVAERVQAIVALLDLAVDPSLGPLRASPYHFAKSDVGRHLKSIGAKPLGQ